MLCSDFSASCLNLGNIYRANANIVLWKVGSLRYMFVKTAVFDAVVPLQVDEFLCVPVVIILGGLHIKMEDTEWVDALVQTKVTLQAQQTPS